MKKYILIFYCINIFAQPGSYDATFSGDGIASTCQTLTYVSVDAGFQFSSKIINFGYSYDTYGASLIRYNNNGGLDTTFGVGGFAQGNINSIFPPNRGYIPNGMAIQTDDKIVIMGLQQSNAFGNGFWIARLLPNGSADATFNGTGYLDLFFGTAQDRGKCIKLQSDGKIIVAGRSGNLGQNFAMARIETNGTFDTTFGIGGKVQTTFLDTQSGVNSIAVQVDGKIILGGWTNNSPYGYDFALIRYTPNGNIDTTFGTNGKVITTVNNFNDDQITKLIIQNDGKILAGGYNGQTSGNYTLVRYLSNGTLDPSFGNNGIAIDAEFTGDCDIVQQIDGKIILAGGENSERFSYLRYLNNGQIDAAFPVNGSLAAVGLLGYASTVLIQPDNKIVICGSTNSNDNTIFCSTVVRLNPGTLSNETFTNTKINVYPNPTNGNVFFDNSINQYENVSVYNYLGQEILEKQLNSTATETIDFNSFSKGVYLLKFKNQNNSEVVKVIRE